MSITLFVNFLAFSHCRTTTNTNSTFQRAKKVVSGSPGPVDFAIGLVNFVFNLPDGQMMCLRNSNNKDCEINSAHQKAFGAS